MVADAEPPRQPSNPAAQICPGDFPRWRIHPGIGWYGLWRQGLWTFSTGLFLRVYGRWFVAARRVESTWLVVEYTVDCKCLWSVWVESLAPTIFFWPVSFFLSGLTRSTSSSLYYCCVLQGHADSVVNKRVVVDSSRIKHPGFCPLVHRYLV